MKTKLPIVVPAGTNQEVKFDVFVADEGEVRQSFDVFVEAGDALYDLKFDYQDEAKISQDRNE